MERLSLRPLEARHPLTTCLGLCAKHHPMTQIRLSVQFCTNRVMTPASPSAVRGPVLRPPCILHRPFAIAAARHGKPVRRSGVLRELPSEGPAHGVPRSFRLSPPTANVVSSTGDVVEFEVEQWYVSISTDVSGPTITMKVRR